MAVTCDQAARHPVGFPRDLSGAIFACKGDTRCALRSRAHGPRLRIEISMFDTMLHLLTYIAPCG